MPTGRDRPTSTPDTVGDGFLLASVAAGDNPALVELMRRYDRLVRYTAFRLCGDPSRRDPQWLDSLASSVWAGVARSVRKPGAAPIENFPSYLIQITRNLCLAELRGAAKVAREADAAQRRQFGKGERGPEPPAAIQERLELLESLRSCLAEVSESERPLVSQLGALLDRRWEEAARNLGMPESTVRSRWPRFLQGLLKRLNARSGIEFAPDGLEEHS